MVTYDIKDLYVNIPIEETLKIMEIQLLKNNDATKTTLASKKQYTTQTNA
jgi:hypothetical protein